MSFYDNSDSSWSAPGRQSSWDQPQQHQQQSQNPPPRSNTSSAMSHQHESGAFASQFEEIERATDNLMKSGKWFPGQMQPGAQGVGPMTNAPRRESVPTSARGHDYGDPRLGGGPSRHHSVSGEFEGGNRPNSAGLQGFYAGQRFPGGRQSEAEQVLQAKRRMAAQRERELRNYHQEQQYNRTTSTSSGGGGGGAKSDRSMSPNTMSEEDRRELIARQHRALYGESSAIYGAEGSGPGSRASSGDVRVPSGGRGTSPLAFDPYGAQAQAQGGAESGVQMPPRDRTESTASPASNPNNQQSYAQQSSRTSASSPGGSPPLIQGQKGGAGGVAPIGTRPNPGPGAPGGLGKRSTTPLTPSALSYGYSADKQGGGNNGKDERSTSAASNSNSGIPADKSVSGLGGWGSNSGVWGSAVTQKKA